MDSIILQRQGRRLLDFFNDREYYRHLFKIAVPIAMQNLIMSLLNMSSVVMIGQLGDAPIAAAALANQIFFLLNLTLFGLASGSAIFTAQLWGRKDIFNIRRVLGLCLTLSLGISFIFLIIAEVFPSAAIGVFSEDPTVIALGSAYLRIFGWSFCFYAVSVSYAAVMRSTGEVRIPLLVTFIALSITAGLNYILIFGKFGFPQLDIYGAAVATLIGRVLECVLLLTLIYRLKLPLAGNVIEMLHLDFKFAGQVLIPVIPVTLNEILWSLGITAYSVAYARIGTSSIAAMNIAGTIDNLALVPFFGLGSACAVLVGNWIGAGDENKAYQYAGRSLGLGALGGALMGGAIWFGAGYILSLYQVTPEVIQYTQRVLTIIALLLWLRVTNLVLFVGVLRSGGDTRFAFVLDGIIIWVVGVPLAFTGAFVFHLPVYWVYLLVMAEEITKWFLGILRYFSKKWIHNLAQTV